MRQTIVPYLVLIILVSLMSGFALSRSSNPVSIKIHTKDLPSHGLRLIGPSDPSFDGRLRIEHPGEPNESLATIKPLSVFFENQAQRPVVAYLIQWCFTTKNGRNQYYRKAVLNPRALMEGENLTPELNQQSGRIEPGAALLLSLLSVDGKGMMRAEINPKEADEFRRGKKLDHTSLMQRFSKEVSQYTEITVMIDGAFFDDGTFVGPDTSNFFAQTQAAVNARRDLLNEIASSMSNSSLTTDSLHERIQATASFPIEALDSESTATDYYNYFKKFYAGDILQIEKLQGRESALKMAVKSRNKPWATMRKKQD